MFMFFKEKEKEIAALEKNLKDKSDNSKQLIEGILHVFRIHLSNKQDILNLMFNYSMNFVAWSRFSLCIYVYIYI